MDAEFWVSIAFVVFVGVLYKAGAFSALVGALDKRSDAIRHELEEAKALRDEAQRVFHDYKAKFAAAEKEVEAIIARAKSDAERYSAEVDAEFESFMARRRAMAEKRIAQAEAGAMAEVRAAAADAAIKASEMILRDTLKGAAGEALVTKDLSSLHAEFN
jgi:F-type H+-transporting ATPase subunit b